MRTLAKVGALSVLVAALVGCGVDGGDDQSDESTRYFALAAQYPETPPMCQWIEGQLAGREATFFKLRFNDEFVALSSGGEVLCVDQPLVALRMGVIPVTNADEPLCDLCDGTPLPADVVIEMARKYRDLRTDL